MTDGSIDPKKLMSIVDRYERIEEEKQALAKDQKSILDDGKESHGFEPKMIKRIVKERKVDPEKRRIEDADWAMYAHAAGLDG